MKKFTKAHGRALSYEHQSAYPCRINVSNEATTAGMHVDINFALASLRNMDYFNPIRARAVSTGGSVLTVNNLVYGLVNDIDRSISRTYSQNQDRVVHSPFEGPEPTGPKMECSPSRVLLPRPKTDEVTNNGGKVPVGKRPGTVGNTVPGLAQLRHLTELNGVIRHLILADSRSPPPPRIMSATPLGTERPTKSNAKNLIPPVVSPAPPTVTIVAPIPIPTLALKKTPSVTALDVTALNGMPVHDCPSADIPVPTLTPTLHHEDVVYRPSRFSARHKFELEPTVQTMKRDTSPKIRAKGPSVGPMRKNFYMSYIGHSMSRLMAEPGVQGRPNNSFLAGRTNVVSPGLRSMWKGDKDTTARQCITNQKRKESIML